MSQRCRVYCGKRKPLRSKAPKLLYQAEHVLRNESQVKPCPILDITGFENVTGKGSCHEASRQKYDRHDGEHHNGPTYFNSFQYPIPRNANLDRIGMLLLQVEHCKQVILKRI